MNARSITALTLVHRIAAAVLASYLFCWGFIAFGVAGLYALGLPFHDAEHLCSLLALLIFLVTFLWAFSAQRMRPVWIVLAGGGLLMTVGASLVQRSLIAAA